MMLKIIRILSRNSLCLWQVTWVIREYNALIWDNQWHSQWFYDLRCMLSCFSYVWLFVTPWTQQAPDVIFQARILEWVAVPASRGSSRLSDWTCISYVSCITSRFFTNSATWKPQMIWGGGTRLQTPAFCITQKPSPPTPKSSDNHLVLHSVKPWVKTQNSGLAFRYINFQGSAVGVGAVLSVSRRTSDLGLLCRRWDRGGVKSSQRRLKKGEAWRPATSVLWVSNLQKKNNLRGAPLWTGWFQAWPENQAHEQLAMSHGPEWNPPGEGVTFLFSRALGTSNKAACCLLLLVW